MAFKHKDHLTVVSDSNLTASPGKFIAIVIIDSECYRIGDERDSFEEANAACNAQPCGSFIQVFDDQGNACRREAAAARS